MTNIVPRLTAALLTAIAASFAFWIAGSILAVLTRRMAAAYRHAVWFGAAVAPIGIIAKVLWWPRLRIPAAALPEHSVALFSVLGAEIALAVWLAGALIILVAATRGGHLSRGTQRMDGDATVAPLLAETGRLALALGIRRRVELRIAEAPVVPSTAGALRPVIVLPPTAVRWPDDKLRAVLLHELAHVARHDYLAEIVMATTLAVLWFIPFVWLTVFQVREERERACDECVLHSGVSRDGYAQHLVDVMDSARAGLSSGLAPVAIGSYAALHERIRRITHDPIPARPSAGGRYGATALITVGLLAVTVAAPAICGMLPR